MKQASLNNETLTLDYTSACLLGRVASDPWLSSAIGERHQDRKLCVILTPLLTASCWELSDCSCQQVSLFPGPRTQDLPTLRGVMCSGCWKWLRNNFLLFLKAVAVDIRGERLTTVIPLVTIDEGGFLSISLKQTNKKRICQTCR